MEVKNLEPYAIIGFDGSAIRGLKVHPDGEHIVYPMGNKVCIQEWKTKRMFFLSGHTNSVSTVAVSPKGTYVGSGQINHIGFKATAKVWDFKKRTVIGSHELHKVRVEALAFSSDERYMISLGGRDDGSVVLWECAAAAATGTAPAAKQTTGDACTLTPLNLRPNSFVTGGDGERYMISLGGRDDGSVVLWQCAAAAATGTVPATNQTTGTVPATKQTTDTVPATKQTTGTVPATKQTTGTVPATKQTTGTVPATKQTTGTMPATKQTTGTVPATKKTTGDACTLTPLNLRPNGFVTGGTNLRVWNIRAESKTLDVVDVSLGKLSRRVRCISISKDDAFGYAGTTTGDMIKFSMNYPSDPAASVAHCKPSLIGCLAKCGPWKKGKIPEPVCYSQGIESVLILDDGCLIVGAGDGTVDLLDEINWKGEFPKSKIANPTKPYFKALKTTKLEGSITSLELMESPNQRGESRLLLAGTRSSEIYAINVAIFSPVLVVTCHRCAINDIAFPRGMSGVFATGGSGDVRVWCLSTGRELLRILVPNFTCSAVLFSADGKAIVTAWNDGNIRAFTPLTGRLMYCIYNTHNKGTSALDMTRDGRTLISGGCEGQVRVWDIRPESQTLKKVLKEHKSPVSAIQVSPNDAEAVSAGTDGSCIIWDLLSLSRRQVMYANTLFMCVRYEPSGCQLLTGGTDRRVAYWETGSGHLARELEASKVGAINGLDISANGELFVTGGNDQMVKVWQYEAGIFRHAGLAHAGAVTCCRFSPDGRFVVSCCAAGAVVVWRVPEEYLEQREAPREDLRLALDAPRAAPVRPMPPKKVEKINAMDTTRSSVHSCCPCEAQTGRSDKAAAKSNGSRCSRPSGDFLPTKTTSKEFISSGGGDKK